MSIESAKKTAPASLAAKLNDLKHFPVLLWQAFLLKSESLRTDPSTRYSLIITVFVQIFHFSFIILKFNSLPPELPLFYSRPWGQPQLASPKQLLLLPFFSMAVFLANLSLAALIHPQEKILGRLLIWSSLIINLMAAYNLYKIIVLIS